MSLSQFQRPVELSVVLPCLNEAQTVGECVRVAFSMFDKLGISGEVVVADNGSSDGSRECATQAGARVVDAPIRGYGAALRAGFNAAEGQYIIMGDADLSYDFSAQTVQRFLPPLRQGAELVIGNRYRGGIMKGAMPWLHRYVGTPVMTLMVRLMFGAKTGDVNCGQRAFPREAYHRLELQSNGMEFASEMIVRAAQKQFRIVEVPVPLRPDGRDRSPHLRTIRDGLRHVRLWLRLRKAHLGAQP